MTLEELRDKIEAVEERMYEMNLKHPYLNAYEQEEMVKMQHEQEELLKKLPEYDYFYIIATLEGNGFTSYLDRGCWHRRHPRPFLSREEAEMTAAKKRDMCLRMSVGEMFRFEIKKHEKGQAE